MPPSTCQPAGTSIRKASIPAVESATVIRSSLNASAPVPPLPPIWPPPPQPATAAASTTATAATTPPSRIASRASVVDPPAAVKGLPRAGGQVCAGRSQETRRGDFRTRRAADLYRVRLARLLPLLVALLAVATASGAGPGDPSNLRTYWSHGTCKGKGPVRLGSPPMRLADIRMILPLGLMVGGHVTPIDHGYYEPADRSQGRSRYDVLAPAKGAIVSIQTRPNGPSTDYRVVIELSCTFWVYYDLVTDLAPRILKAAGWTAQSTGTALARIPVKEGEVIGKVGAQTLDVGVVNGAVTLRGFVTPEHYVREPWKIHTVDLFASFKEPLRGKLLAKNPRTAEPRGGRINYDVDGRLVGNWFLQGTNWYAGTCDSRSSPNGCSYWTGHLAFAYDYLDPTQMRVSVGDFGGREAQFGVAGNGPDPRTVSAATGPVRYELVQWSYYRADGSPWDRFSYTSGPTARNGSQVFGTLLAQLVGPRTLKMEAFPGKTSADVAGFTAAARLYER